MENLHLSMLKIGYLDRIYFFIKKLRFLIIIRFIKKKHFTRYFLSICFFLLRSNFIQFGMTIITI